MKRLSLFLCAALAIAGVVSCEEDGPVDFPIVGDFTLTGESTNAATSSWYPGEQIGVFVTSDGVTQTNLLYAPSETCEDKSVLLDENDPTSKYWMFGDPVGNVALTPKDKAAGFKQGVHNIYVYSPYNAAATDVTAIPMPDLTSQDDTAFQGQVSNPAMSFIYASAEVKEHTTAPIDLGKFTSLYYGLNTGTIDLKGTPEGVTDLKIVKLIISADKTIAYKNPTFNFVENKINGEPASIEVKTELAIAEDMAFDFESMSMKPVIGSDGPAKFMIIAPATTEDFKTMKFSFTAVLSDGSEYSGSDITPSVMSYTDPDTGVTEVMVTLGGQVVLTKK